MKIFQFRAQMQRPIQSANEHRNSQGRRIGQTSRVGFGLFPRSESFDHLI